MLGMNLIAGLLLGQDVDEFTVPLTFEVAAGDEPITTQPQLRRVEYTHCGLRWTGDVIAVSHKYLTPKHAQHGWWYLVQVEGRTIEHWVNEGDVLNDLSKGRGIL